MKSASRSPHTCARRRRARSLPIADGWRIACRTSLPRSMPPSGATLAATKSATSSSAESVTTRTRSPGMPEPGAGPCRGLHVDGDGKGSARGGEEAGLLRSRCDDSGGAHGADRTRLRVAGEGPARHLGIEKGRAAGPVGELDGDDEGPERKSGRDRAREARADPAGGREAREEVRRRRGRGARSRAGLGEKDPSGAELPFPGREMKRPGPAALRTSGGAEGRTPRGSPSGSRRFRQRPRCRQRLA